MGAVILQNTEIFKHQYLIIMNEILELIKTEASNVVRLIVQRKTELNMMRQNPSVEGAVLSAIRDRVSDIETVADRLCSKLEQDHFTDTSKMVPSKDLCYKFANLYDAWKCDPSGEDETFDEYVKEHWNDEND